MPNRVIGIDPGFDRIGVAVLEGTGTAETLLYSECITTLKKDAHDKRLLALGTRLEEIILEWKPKELAIEKLFFNQNATSALKVAEARGVIIFEAAQAGLPVYEYSPQDVKIAVTGYGKADKVAVEGMVRKLVKMPDGAKKLDDEIDAIAVGITHLATGRAI
ncbi:crossover junction endodeoxyribonuclease RuvC [Candidatus Parcubacteria bacterium]|nr:crossover junction endodeoxyribonuclease RuvC [Candidatus Parcubacteria bacterium]